MGKRIALIVAFVSVCLAGAHADTWAPPEPKGYACNAAYPDSGPVAYVEVFPPGCLLNPTDRAVCYYYTFAGLDCGRQRDVALRWKGNLVNPVMPHRVFVPRDGESLVTLDDYARIGYDNCVVIYGDDGGVLGRYSLSDLYSDEIVRNIPTSNSSRSWLEDPRAMFSDDGRHFYLMPIGPGAKSDRARGRHVFRFDLRTGEMRTLLSPETDEGSGYTGEGDEYRLRFSSITEMRNNQTGR
jgi:hypothetical protein